MNTLMFMRKRIRKVLLFAAPAFSVKDNLDINPLPPLGLAYLGAALEKMDIEVKIYDALAEGWDERKDIGTGIVRVGASFEEIKRQIAEFDPDIVGVNNLFTKQRDNAHRIYALAKEVNPEIITIAGGAHPTVMPNLVMQDSNVDFSVLGEGEETIKRLIEHIEGKGDIDALDGIAFRKNGIVNILPKVNFIRDLDAIAFPARHLLNMDRYFGLEVSHGQRRHRLFSPIITSRGCPAGCLFCSAHNVWGRGYRKRSAGNVIDEMYEMKERYGIRELMFEDDNVTLDVGRAEEIFDGMIKACFGFSWDTPNGVAAFALTERLIDKMKQAGCYKLNLAVESGNADVLNKIIKKPLNLSRVKALVDYARSIDLDVGIFLIVGMPGETREQIWDTFRFADNLKIYDPFISVATPYPGSELYRLCREKGYIREDYCLDNLHISSFSIGTEEWSCNELKGLFERGCLYLQKRFYRRHPLLLMRLIFKKLFVDPRGLLRKLWLALKVG